MFWQLRQLARVELWHGLRREGRRFRLAGNERDLDHHAGRAIRGSAAHYGLAEHGSLERQLEFVDTKDRCLSRGMPPGPGHDFEIVAGGFIGAVIEQDAVAAPKRAAGKMRDAGPLAKRRLVPSGICSVLEH